MEDPFDIVGLGFGPANLAIAGALVESWEDPKCQLMKRVLFIDIHEKFFWHPGMLLPGTKMQISFMKDLATLRNPRSPITFLSYLHSQGRLNSFINRGLNTPARKEYSDYLSWAADYVEKSGINVKYRHKVIGLSDGFDGTLHVHCEFLATGDRCTYRARNLVIAPGGSPKLPASLSPVLEHPRVIHSSTYASSINSILDHCPRSKGLHIAVIGSGQSAAEVALDLRQRLGSISPDSSLSHSVEIIMKNGALRPSDDSPFANEIFDPQATDFWYTLKNPTIRERHFQEYKDTNYGVVNPRTIEALYEIIYDQKLEDSINNRTGQFCQPAYVKIVMKPYSLVVSGETRISDDSGIWLVLRNSLTRSLSEHRYDAVICCTGYERNSWVDLLKRSNLASRFGLDPSTETSRCALMPARMSRGSGFADPELITEISGSLSIGSNADETSEDAEIPTNASPANSETSTTPSTPELTSLAHPANETLYITRNYRLIPSGSAGKPGGDEVFEPRIYLQGMEEATHGLSDTLLSVIGIRAGEVVNDLYGTL